MEDWRPVYDFWFPPGLDDADAGRHREMFGRWFGGGADAGMVPFAPLLAAAGERRLAHWRDSPLGRLSLIIVLDQFPRGLAAGTREAYAHDPSALAIAEEGLGNGHYAALTRPWERTFFFLPLAHAEGVDHRERLARVVAMADAVARAAPGHLRALYEFSANQARGHLEVISRFGRFPHRNAILGRASTSEEEAYVQAGDFVHRRRPPDAE